SLDATQRHYQLLAIGVQPQLVGVHTAHGKIFQMPVAFVHGIDADDSLAARIVVGSGIESVAGLAEHPMPVEMKAVSSFNYCLKNPVQHIDYIEVAPGAAGENDCLVGMGVQATAVAALRHWDAKQLGPGVIGGSDKMPAEAIIHRTEKAQACRTAVTIGERRECPGRRHPDQTELDKL